MSAFKRVMFGGGLAPGSGMWPGGKSWEIRAADTTRGSYLRTGVELPGAFSFSVDSSTDLPVSVLCWSCSRGSCHLDLCS